MPVEATRSPAPSIGARVRLISVLCACVAGMLGLVGLAGWVFGDLQLTRLHASFASMKLNTTLMLLALAGSRLVRGRVAVLCAAPAALIAAATLTEYFARHSLGVDQLLVTDPGGGPHPGRPSFATALGVLLLACAALPAVARRRRTTETLTLTVFAGAFLALLGYVYGVHSLYVFRPFSSIAVHTAAALLLLALSGVAAVDRGLATWIAAGNKPGATLMRVICPVSFIALPVLGYACVAAERRRWLAGSELVALNVLFCLTTMITAGWLAGVRLDRFDTRRKNALSALSELAEDLERQVIERSSQLQRGHDDLVLLADRQRIAADLHDIVVQRLFATGMMLNSVDPSRVEASIGQRIDDAIEAMDSAIIDLRASIFELNSSTTRSNDLLSSLDTLCTDASRVLGFLPDLTVDDPDDAAAEIHADVLAVARESLANVARHAAASSAEVVLRCRAGVLALEIVDDGIGISHTPHSSGTQNMADRARRLGGNCEWLPVEPHGTRVRWHIPAPSPATPQPAATRVSELIA